MKSVIGRDLRLLFRRGKLETAVLPHDFRNLRQISSFGRNVVKSFSLKKGQKISDEVREYLRTGIRARGSSMS